MGGRKAQPGQGSDPFLCEELRTVVDLRGGTRGGHPLPPGRAAASLHPFESSPGKMLRPLSPSSSGLVSESSQMLLSEGGGKSQAQGTYSQCSLTFSPGRGDPGRKAPS